MNNKFSTRIVGKLSNKVVPLSNFAETGSFAMQEKTWYALPCNRKEVLAMCNKMTTHFSKVKGTLKSIMNTLKVRTDPNWSYGPRRTGTLENRLEFQYF